MVYRESKQFRKRPHRSIPEPLECNTKRDFIDYLARRIKVDERYLVKQRVIDQGERDKSRTNPLLPWDKNDCMRPSDFFTWARNQKKWEDQIKRYETKYSKLPKNAVVEVTGLQITSAAGEDIYAMVSGKDEDIQKQVQGLCRENKRLRRENKKLREELVKRNFS